MTTRVAAELINQNGPMSDLSATQDRTVSATGVKARYDVAIHRDLASVEAIWRSLEQRCVLTPYQRYDWVAALVAADAEAGSELAIAVIRTGTHALGLLPLALVRSGGLTRAHLLGVKQSNSDWLIAEPGFQPGAEALRDIFRAVSQAVGGIDLLSLSNLPSTWQGHANPLLVLPHAPAASNLYTATIGPTPVPYIEHRLNTKRRSNIKRGMRRLAEQHGEVRLVHVQDATMLERVHQAFLDQRGARFAEMGVDNIFARAPFLDLFRDLTAASFGKHRPALCLHALMAGDEIVATSWGLQSGDHYSQYINSTTAGPAARYSLMGILVAELMDALTVTGITTFDMGLGDFEYKVEWTEPEPVYNSLVPLTLKGRMASATVGWRDAGKRVIKQTPALWRIAQWIRLRLFQLRGGK